MRFKDLTYLYGTVKTVFLLEAHTILFCHVDAFLSIPMFRNILQIRLISHKGWKTLTWGEATSPFSAWPSFSFRIKLYVPLN